MSLTVSLPRAGSLLSRALVNLTCQHTMRVLREKAATGAYESRGRRTMAPQPTMYSPALCPSLMPAMLSSRSPLSRSVTRDAARKPTIAFAIAGS